MNKKEEIRKSLKQLSANSFELCTGVVKKVNGYTCEVEIDTGIVLKNVRLKSVIDSSDECLLITPELGSDVIIGFIEYSETDSFIVQYSKIKTIEINVSNDIILNKGTNKGLIKIDELKSELNKVNEVLQAFLNTISGTPASQPANAPDVLWAALKIALAGKALPTYETIENNKIKH